jgi:hypothetical protein
MESFVRTHYVEHQGLNPDYPAWQTVQYTPMATPEQSSYYTEEEAERIPPGKLAVRRGTKVEATVHLKLDKKAIGQLPAIPVRRHYASDS